MDTLVYLTLTLLIWGTWRISQLGLFEPGDDTGAYSNLQGQDLAALGVPDMDAYIDAYCRRLGFSEMPHRNFYLGFSQFRYAAMIQGILKRVQIGTAANRTILHRQDWVQKVAALARRTLEGKA